MTSLPQEILDMIRTELIRLDEPGLAPFATVNRSWQRAIENKTFQSLMLTPYDLRDPAIFHKIGTREPLVRRISIPYWGTDIQRPTLRFLDFLRTWPQLREGLVLDIGVGSNFERNLAEVVTEEIPAVTSLVLTSSPYRRYQFGVNTESLLRFLPGLREISFVPDPNMERVTDEVTEEVEWSSGIFLAVFLNLIVEGRVTGRLKSLKKLTLFHPFVYDGRLSPAFYQDLIRVSAGLESLSASFFAKAENFFAYVLSNDALLPPGGWDNLTTFTMTSPRLRPLHNQGVGPHNLIHLVLLLQYAARAAIQMPCLKVMELWHADEWVSLFRFEVCPAAGPADPTTTTTTTTHHQTIGRITWRGNWNIGLKDQHDAIQAWKDLVWARNLDGLEVMTEIIPGHAAEIRPVGEALRLLELRNRVL
ncbi:hypothetical protein QBC43DRAFT_298807 [Cladorrhinum sp. PSN259]|nr:hypothetical protein QBC43DRAFT_298807 [Cladorrhinum sp. PSN259]